MNVQLTTGPLRSERTSNSDAAIDEILRNEAGTQLLQCDLRATVILRNYQHRTDSLLPLSAMRAEDPRPAVRPIVADVNRKLSGAPEAQVFAFPAARDSRYRPAIGVEFLRQERAARRSTIFGRTLRSSCRGEKTARRLGGHSRFHRRIRRCSPQSTRSQVLKLGLCCSGCVIELQTLLGGFTSISSTASGAYGRVRGSGAAVPRPVGDVCQFLRPQYKGAMVPLATLVDMSRVVCPEDTTRFNDVTRHRDI